MNTYLQRFLKMKFITSYINEEIVLKLIDGVVIYKNKILHFINIEFYFYYLMFKNYKFSFNYKKKKQYTLIFFLIYNFLFYFILHYITIIKIKNFIFFIDNISFWFINLTILLCFFCLLNAFETIKYKYISFYYLLNVLQIILLLLFSVSNLFFFYILFEFILIPMFFIIGIWGSRTRKIHAVYLFFFYTFLASILFLICIFILQNGLKSLEIILLMQILNNVNQELILWLFLFIAFAVKVPMFPFHVWLPEAHVEAPTIGSVLLAGILLKLGTYGMLRYLLPLFPFGSIYFYPLVALLCIIAIIYISLTAIRQIDLKKIIAYASIAHMAYVILGLFSSNINGLIGSIYLMLGHGFVSGALFFTIGFLYERYHTRLFLYYSGLLNVMPLFSTFFFIFLLCNISFPGTVNFIGELLILNGVFSDNWIICFIITLAIIPGSIYSIWLYNRIICGSMTIYLNKYTDLTSIEYFIFNLLFCFVIIWGIFPTIIIEQFEYICTYIIQQK